MRKTKNYLTFHVSHYLFVYWRLVWYEEYPTSPPTFVLNGFMYSLLGLFDLKDALEVHELTG